MKKVKDFFINHKKKIIGSVFGIMVLFGIGMSIGKLASIGTPQEIKQILLQEVEETKEQMGLEYIHKMTNSVITSNQIWGKKEITKSSINKALKYAKGDYLLTDYLTQWKNGDFSNSVDFHNYVWDRLDGNIGEARGLNVEKIEEVVERLK